MVTVNIRGIDPAVWKQLRHFALDRDLTMGELFNQMAADYLRRESKEREQREGQKS
jgi:hypothetical protein